MGAPVTMCAPVRNLDNQVWYHNTDNQGEGLCNQGEVFPISCFKWKNPGEGFKLKKKTQGGFFLGEGFSNCYTGSITVDLNLAVWIIMEFSTRHLVHSTPTGLVGWNQLRPVRTSLI